MSPDKILIQSLNWHQFGYSRQLVMSALPSKADVCGAIAHVRFGPKADMATLFDHLLRDRKDARRNGQAERLRGLEIDNEFILGRRLHREFGWLFAL